jgi:hypothetical protein
MQTPVLGVVLAREGYAAVDLDSPSLYLAPSDLGTVACDPQRAPAGLGVASDRRRNKTPKREHDGGG